MLEWLIQDHELGDLDCPNCIVQLGHCSCGGVLHSECQTTLNGIPPIWRAVECDNCGNCDEYELE